MRRFALLFLLFLGSIPITWSQITITNSVFPVAGDTLFYAVDNAPSGIVITPPGADQKWDFSGLQKTFTQQEIYRDASEGSAYASFPNATLVIQNDSMLGPESYLRVTPQQVTLLGFSGGGPLTLGIDLDVIFSPPLVQQRAPVKFFDITNSNSNILVAFPADLLPGGGQLPVSPDSIRVRVSISNLDVVDGWGTLTIPGGTYEVLRERRTTYTETRIDAKIQPIGWLDVTDLAGQFIGLNGLGVDTSVVYSFLSNESKEPIAVCETDSTQLQVVSVQFKNVDRTTGIYYSPRDLEPLVLFPNPVSDMLNIRKGQWTNGEHRVVISSLLGQELISAERDLYGNADVSVDVSGLPPGVYHCRLYQEDRLVGSKLFIRQ